MLRATQGNMGRAGVFVACFLAGLVTISLAILSSCKEKRTLADNENTSDDRITETVSFASFPHQKKVHLSETGINGFYSSIRVVDTFLVCGDYRSPDVINIFGMSSGKLISRSIKRGELYGQCLSVANIIPAKAATFWVYDITGGKLLMLDIQKILSDTSYKCNLEVNLNDAVRKAKSPCRVNDTLFSATTYTRDDCRFITFNTRSEIVSTTGKLPQGNEVWPKGNSNGKFNLLASIYTASLVHHPETDVTIVAYNKTDRIEVYEAGNLKKVIRGPDIFDPIMDFVNEGDEVMANENTATRFSFSSISSTKSSFFCLYSGEANFSTCSSKLLVFDWNGVPMQTLELDRPICFFTVVESEAGMIIYAIEKETGNVLRASY